MLNTNHPDHDLLLIAAHAAGDLAASERTRAQGLVETCEPCAILHADLVAIALATRSLPRHAVAPRHFQLSPEQAARLRRGSWLRTILAPLSGARSASRPMAAAFTSLGVAGLLVASLLPGMLGAGASSAPQRETSEAGRAVDAAATAAPAAPPGATAPGATAAAGPDAVFGGKVSENASEAPEIAIAGGAAATPVAALEASTNATTSNPPSPLFIGSLALLAVGLLLFGLRSVGRRLN